MQHQSRCRPVAGSRQTTSRKHSRARISPIACSSQPTGTHAFDPLCEVLGIEHRLSKAGTPQTNAMLERFNGRISDIRKTHHFLSGEAWAAILRRDVFLCNKQLPQSALGSQTPAQTMHKCFISNPELLYRKPDDQPGCDISAIHDESAWAPSKLAIAYFFTFSRGWAKISRIDLHHGFSCCTAIIFFD